MKKQGQSSSLISPKSSFWGDWLYCPAHNNVQEISFPASLFLHPTYWYYVRLRKPFRDDIKKKLFHYLKSGDVFAYSGGFIKIINRSVVEIYDTLDPFSPATIYYKSKYNK